MATRTFKTWTKRHQSPLFCLGGRGDDTFNFTIPSGYKFVRADLKVLGGRYNDGARIDDKPAQGTTGNQKIIVHWWFDGGTNPMDPSYIRYRLKVIIEKVTARAIIVAIENTGRFKFLESLSDKVRKPIERFADAFMETSAVTIAHNLFDNYYDRVEILDDTNCTKENIKQNLLTLGNEYIVDLAIEGHGDTGYLELHANQKLYESEVRSWIGPETENLNLRLVYMMNCKGSKFNDAWLDLGFKTSIGPKNNNYMPEPMFSFFWTFWKTGMKANDAALKAWNDSKLIWQIVYPQKVKISRIDKFPYFKVTYSDHQRIKDSRPVVAGRKSIRITSDV